MKKTKIFVLKRIWWQVYEESPKASYIIVQQLIWREFFYVMSTNNPFYDEIGGFYAASY